MSRRGTRSRTAWRSRGPVGAWTGSRRRRSGSRDPWTGSHGHGRGPGWCGTWVRPVPPTGSPAGCTLRGRARGRERWKRRERVTSCACWQSRRVHRAWPYHIFIPACPLFCERRAIQAKRAGESRCRRYLRTRRRRPSGVPDPRFAAVGDRYSDEHEPSGAGCRTPRDGPGRSGRRQPSRVGGSSSLRWPSPGSWPPCRACPSRGC